MFFSYTIKGAIFFLVISLCSTANAVDERITLQSFVQEIDRTYSHSASFNPLTHLQKFATNKSTRDILYELIKDINNTNSHSDSFYAHPFFSDFAEGVPTRKILISFIERWQDSACGSNSYNRHNIKY